MQAFKHLIPWAWVFTRTQFNASYASWIPKKFIIPNFDPGVLRQIMDRQTMAIEMRLGDYPHLNARAWVNWDDYNGDNIRYNEVLKDYYFTGRHYWTLNTFSAQHITLTPPAIRSNTDLVVLFNTDYADSLDHYHRDFAGKLTRDVFLRLFTEAVSEKNHFLAIDNTPNTPYDRKFFTGKAEMLDDGPDWIFGCADFWKENVDQLIAITKGKYNVFAEIVSQNAEYVTPEEAQRENERKRILKPYISPWMPYKFPIPCPDQGILDHKPEERQRAAPRI